MAKPRILIAGAHSGSGKTTLALGLVAALRRRGLRVQTFKVGPDFLDPTHLAAASGRPCYNLDGWMCGRPYVEKLFSRTTQDADLAIIEGVMGLFDGADPAGLAGSSAEIAGWLQVSVLLLVNTHGMARSIAPLVAGFTEFEPCVRIGGVIANHCGSPRHKTLLTKALIAAGLPPLLGAVPRAGFPELQSRHLGLVTANPTNNCSEAVLDEFAAAAERHLALDKIINLAHSAPLNLQGVSDSMSRQALPRLAVARGARRMSHRQAGIRLGVARDEAFHFYYQDLFDELQELGCVCEWFSPLRDSCLPEDLDAVYLGGGYPEEFAAHLSANHAMMESIRRFSELGRPLYAECGGLMYLSRAITTRDGLRHPLLGILPTETRMLDRRKRLGYVEVTLRENALWGTAGERMRGHEFHYSELLSNPTVHREWCAAYHSKPRNGDRQALEGYYWRSGRILASYVHLHLASHPPALEHFVTLCAQIRSGKFSSTTSAPQSPG